MQQNSSTKSRRAFQSHRKSSSIVGRLLLALTAGVLTIASTVVTTAPEAEAALVSQSFADWTFDWEIHQTRNDGLSLNNVTYDGVRIFERISLPTMTVYYDNNACGPYADRIGGYNYSQFHGEQFTYEGKQWLSIGITDTVGQYVITQMFYLSDDGEIDAHIFSRGLQCSVNHIHLPHWRMDFDIAAPGNDQIRRKTNNGMQSLTSEFDRDATDAVDHGWEVHDTASGDYVTIDFDDGSFNAGGVIIPETDYVENRVYGRQYNSNELAWVGGHSAAPYPDIFSLRYNNNQSMSNPVLWYTGYMPHAGSEGSATWHSTGVRMKVHNSNGGGNDPGTIGNRVTDSSGGGVAGVAVDLFTEGRASYLQSATTNSSGNYSFSAPAGCYVVTFVAPSGATFSDGSQYLNRDVCISAGQANNSIDAQLAAAGGAATIGDQVTAQGGAGVSGVNIDLFTANSDGSRNQYLQSTTTNASGNYSFDVPNAGCYVVTFVGSNGTTFVGSNSQWLESPVCVTAGQNDNSIDAVIQTGGGGDVTIGNRVTDSNGGVPNVGVDLFTTNADGTRGSYIRSTTTSTNGWYSFTDGPGCYTVTFIAPNGRTFAATGNGWHNISACLTAGQNNTSIDSVLN